MERLNFGESKTIFKKISCIVINGLTTTGRKPWQEDEKTREHTNIVLIHQEKKFLISEFFKVIQDAIPLILIYRTKLLFRTVTSNTLIILDVESIYIHRQFRIDTGK